MSHYGHSSQFFDKELRDKWAKLFKCYSAVRKSSDSILSKSKAKLPIPLITVYPKEGTLFRSHPVGIVERDWLTSAHYEAAQAYMDYLLDKLQQEKALQCGFRPANVSMPLAPPIDTAFGVNPKAPKTTCPRYR